MVFSGWNRQGLPHNVTAKVKLDPPLVDDMHHIRFTPNGRYILAQDSGSIYVLSREPFEFLFRIEAPDAAPAQSSPDSNSIVFHNRRLRVEVWDVASRKRTRVHELLLQRDCLLTELSPDGKTLACTSPDFGFPFTRQAELLLVDVASGTELSRTKLPAAAEDRLLSDSWMPYLMTTLKPTSTAVSSWSRDPASLSPLVSKNRLEEVPSTLTETGFAGLGM